MNEEEKKAIKILKEIEINTYAEGKAIAIDTALKLIKKLQKENEELKDKYATFVKMSCEIVEQSIPVQKVKDNLIKYQEEYELLLEHQSGKESNRTKYLRGRIHMCQELLEERK